MKKVPGVESVKVSLSEGMAHIQLAAGNAVSLEQLRKAVNEQGFTPKEATVIVAGDVVTRGKETLFKVNGSNDSFELDPTEAMKLKGVKAATVKGLVASPENGKSAQLKIAEVLKS